MSLVELRAGRSRLRLAPDVGGAMADWFLGDVPILRPASDADIATGEAFRLGSYPLVPYSNRINDGRFRFDGQRHKLALNFGERPHSIHGIGWQRRWAVTKAMRSRAVLSLDHDLAAGGSEGWPFPFHAEQHFALTADELTVTMKLVNTGRGRMPAGIGQHPYFPRTPGVELQFRAGSVWHNGANYLPSHRTKVPARWRYDTSRPLGEPGLDNCFAGWRGAARIVWPEHRLALSIHAGAPHRHCIVFTPAGQDFFAFEPVSHMNDGINRMPRVTDHGIRILRPGKTLEGTVRFRLGKV